MQDTSVIERSILIVEDEAIVALDLKLQLQDLGFAVCGVAASGERALELIAEKAPDLIMMDVHLQGLMDGIDVAELVRGGHGIPVIFLTSHSDDETVRRAAQAAAYGYLTKPYQLRELRAGIEVALTKAAMERQLRAADRWFTNTLQCVADGVIAVDLQAGVRFLNPAAERLTGWATDDARGQPVGDVVHFAPLPATPADDASGAATPPGAEPPTSMVARVLQQGRAAPVAYGRELIARDGRVRTVDETAGPVNTDTGERLGAVLVLRDATERIAREAQLRASEERFRGAFDAAPLGMALVSLGGEIIQANAALGRLLGVTVEAVKAHSRAALTPDDDLEHEAARLRELLGAPHTVVQFETRFLHLGGGEPVWTLVSASLLYEGGAPTCYLYQVHDLTAQRHAAAQLAELVNERIGREALELANKARTAFLSRVSHEMRTPLNAVIGFAQLLQIQPGLTADKIDTFARHIRIAGEHLLVLVTDLLDLDRSAHGKLQLALGPLELEAVVEEASQLLDGLAAAHAIGFDVQVPPGLVVVADRTRLRQVLLNLGSNAVKYNRAGGTVRIRAAVLGTGRIELRIEDTGIGMTPDQQQRLFRPFERLGREFTSIPGTGIGLVIAHNLVAEMGGELRVTSAAGEGTVVTVELASARAEPGTP